ncbi:uncharacterized protein BROUX77_001215 [Berkeleyomyces rouxiae]|uniref:uncharacterized protein n=1 Tax=Berkeleyomyces rouxiae TaxID=2035830 RepID=UPI003B7D0278
MDQLADLILTPFRDIIEKGQAAAENAGSENPAMAKAAQNLIKEGERALKTIEPKCQRHMDEFGANFIDAVKESDEIATFRAQLNDLLWEFDSYIDLDGFDVSKYTELQQASRKAAPRINEIIMRMRIEPVLNPAMSTYGGSNDNASISTFPCVRPTSLHDDTETTTIAISSPRSHNIITSHSHRSSEPPVLELDTTIHQSQSQIAPLTQHTAVRPNSQAYPSPPSLPFFLPAPPRPPSANPWDITSKPGAGQILGSPKAPVNPDASPLPAPPASLAVGRTCSFPADDTFQPKSGSPLTASVSHPLASRVSLETQGVGPELRNTPPSSEQNLARNEARNLQAHVIDNTTSSTPIGRERELSTGSPSGDVASSWVHVSPTTIHEQGALPTRASVVSFSPQSPPTTISTSHHSSTNNLNNSSSMTSNVENQLDTLSIGNSASSQHDSGNARPAATSVFHNDVSGPCPIPQYDDGLIVVESSEPTNGNHNSPTSIVNPPLALTTPKATRIRSDSSFHIYKGFCPGALDVLNGIDAVMPIRKQTVAGPHTVGRCTHCMFELDFKELEHDQNRDDRGNFTINGLGFRLRMLQKSHVATRRNDEQFYACVFCVSQGHTTEESDATIFFTQKDLFDHLSRHPRPFPPVERMAIIQSQTIPEALKNNYDLHVKSPQTPSMAIDRAGAIANKPTAICKETVKRNYGMRTLNSNTPVFEMAEGARIVGIEFPERYEGEWCMGYHDGQYASFPFDLARLEQPPSEQIQRNPTSTIQAVARWKFAPRYKGRGDWLKFDRKEVISNISYVSRSHWCWSGTNSKGKWGIFPASHIDINSVAEADVTPDTVSISGSSKTSKSLGGGFFARLTTKKKSDKVSSPMPRAW